jgi:hypothetical protein
MTACRAKVSLSPLYSSLRWRVARRTMQHIRHGGQQPIARAAAACAGCRPIRDFPRLRENTGKNRFRTTLEAVSVPVSHWNNVQPWEDSLTERTGKQIGRSGRRIGRTGSTRESPIRTNRKLPACSSGAAAASSRSTPAGGKRRQGGTTLRPAIPGENLRSIRNCAECVSGAGMWNEFEQDAPR